MPYDNLVLQRNRITEQYFQFYTGAFLYLKRCQVKPQVYFMNVYMYKYVQHVYMYMNMLSLSFLQDDLPNLRTNVYGYILISVN